MGPDLKDPRWMYLKAIGFAVIMVISAGILIAQSMSFEILLLVGVLVWASARLYYFCFYVIERYIDPDFKFAGIGSVLRSVVRRDR